MSPHRLAMALIFIAAVACSRTNPDKKILFSTSGQSDVPYRIPALGAFGDGTLIAISAYRPCRADIGYGRVDLHVTGLKKQFCWKAAELKEQWTADSVMLP